MTPVAEVLKKEDEEEKEYVLDKKEYWQNELKSLGIEEPNHHLLQNELDDREEELQALAESIKSVYYQAYNTAYSSSNQGEDSNKEEVSR